MCAHGDTYDEARARLEQVKRDFLEIWLEEGCDIPEPKYERWLEGEIPARHPVKL